MDEMWKRLLTVLALGLVLPQLMIYAGSKYYAMQPEPTEPPQTTQPPREERDVVIHVLMSENLVLQMDLEDYVRGVVLAEMPTSFGEEALKAQAVAARTYALRRMTLEDRHPLGAVCTDSTCCQAWISDAEYVKSRGTAADVEKTGAAVENTAGLVVTYRGNLAETTYFSCSGGRTESAKAVWKEDIPYLRAVDSPGEEWAEVFASTVFLTPEELSACLGRTLTGSPKTWLGKEKRTEGGGVDTLVIGGITYSGVELRKLLGLASTSFTATATEEGITFTVRGRGHRVGLSQYGAGSMARNGRDFTEILTHYYPGTKIDKWERIG